MYVVDWGGGDLEMIGWYDRMDAGAWREKMSQGQLTFSPSICPTLLHSV